jgi:hypothetical protein
MTTEREVGSTTGASVVLQVMVYGCFILQLQSEVRLLLLGMVHDSTWHSTEGPMIPEVLPDTSYTDAAHATSTKQTSTGAPQSQRGGLVDLNWSYYVVNPIKYPCKYC